MAEGWARHLKSGLIEPCSAGLEPEEPDPRAVRIMAEAGVDISAQRPKRIDELPEGGWDCVVTVCGHANEHCPVFPDGTQVVHAGLDDPPRLAEGARTEDEALAHYRRVRDEIRAFVETLPEALSHG